MGKTIRVAAIGCGGCMRVHLRRLLEIPEVRLVALVDPAEESLVRTRRQFPALAPVPDFPGHRRMLAEVAPDAVVIATPHTLHSGQVVDALKAGAHVLCEKPLACSTVETRRIIAQARRSRRHVVVSFQRRQMAMWREVRGMVRDKSFGRPVFVQSFLSQGWLKLVAKTWRQTRALGGGGQLNDSGAHLIDMIFWVMPSRPVQVSAMIENRGREVDIDSAIAFRFADGCLGTLSVIGSGPTPAFWEDVTISGSGGRGLFVREGRLTVVDDTSTTEIRSFHGDGDPDRHFVEVVLGRARNLSPPADFLPNIAFTEACWRSAKAAGRPVSIRY